MHLQFVLIARMRFAVPGALLAFLFVGLNTAMPWLEPIEIPTGLMAAIGFSPLPIEVPGLGLIPKELLRKQNSVLYPPPNNWCGFVGGNPGQHYLSFDLSVKSLMNVDERRTYYHA